MTHNEFKPQASFAISNAGGIEIMLSPTGDWVYFRFNYGQEDITKEPIREAAIDYIRDADLGEDDLIAGFWDGDMFYELGNFIRFQP